MTDELASQIRLLQTMVDADIARSGGMESFLVRAGLLKQILAEASEVVTLREALTWAVSKIGRPTLVRGQNDEHYRRWHEAKALTEKTRMKGDAA